MGRVTAWWIVALCIGGREGMMLGKRTRGRRTWKKATPHRL